MRRAAVTMLLCGVILAVLGSPALATHVRLSSAERHVLALVNAQRASHDLAPLRAQANLFRAARAHAHNMATVPFFSHTSPDGRSPSQRAIAAGYTTQGFRSWTIGEAIAWGSGECASPEEIVGSWMKSPAHRAVLLGKSYRDVGIGVAVGSYDEGGVRLDAVTYFTVDMGQRTH
jgi:uncharacterized protein YkwD